MIKTNMIVDAEVRVVHPEARNPEFASRSREPVRRDVYSSPDIDKAVQLWGEKALLDSMQQCGIDYAIVSGLAWNDASILKDNNAYVFECLYKYPDRLRGLYTPDPSEPECAASEIMALDTKYYVGVELIPKWQNTRIDNPELRPIFEAVQEKNMYMKAYTAHLTQTLDGDAPYRTLQLLKQYPEMKVLIPHLGGLLCIYALFPPIAKHLKNAYFITSVSATMKMVEFAAAVNSANLLFGTDFPFNHSFDQETPLTAMRGLTIDESIKNAILGNNATILFGL